MEITYTLPVKTRIDKIVACMDAAGITHVSCRLKKGSFVFGKIVKIFSWQNNQQPYLVIKGERLEESFPFKGECKYFEKLEKGRFSLGSGTRVIRISGTHKIS